MCDPRNKIEKPTLILIRKFNTMRGVTAMKAQGSLKNKPNVNYWSVIDPDLPKIKNAVAILYRIQMSSISNIIQYWKHSALSINTICYDCVGKWKGYHATCPFCLSENGLESVSDNRFIEMPHATEFPEGSEFWNSDDWQQYWDDIDDQSEIWEEDGLPEEYPDFMVDEDECGDCFTNRYGERCHNSICYNDGRIKYRY